MLSAPIQIVIYTRAGCHLCEEAERLLLSRRANYSLVIKTIDVDLNVELTSRFGDCVPVVTINGTERFRGGVAPALLDRVLRIESASLP
jgi:glutaredoxin